MQFERVAREMVHYGVERIDGKWRARCAGCNQFRFMSFPPIIDPDNLIAKFRKAGWSMERNKPPLCGACADGVEIKTKEETMTTRDVKGELSTNNVVPLSSVSSTAISAVAPGTNDALFVAVVSLLAVNFDKVTHTYAKGFSDEEVAKQTGAHVDAVFKWREAHFGALAEPPQMTTLRENIGGLETELIKQRMEMETSLAQHHAKLDQLARTLDNLKAELEKVSRPFHRRAQSVS